MRGVNTPADAARAFRIMVVDNEPALAMILSRLLATDGHEVAIATSGEEAMTMLARSPTDVVISDLGLGIGMNGWELAAALRGMPSPPHFILATGWGGEIDDDEAAGRGVRAVVSKPYRLSDLRRILRTL
jgi:CheY-like chemotaxis protein